MTQVVVLGVAAADVQAKAPEPLMIEVPIAELLPTGVVTVSSVRVLISDSLSCFEREICSHVTSIVDVTKERVHASRVQSEARADALLKNFTLGFGRLDEEACLRLADKLVSQPLRWLESEFLQDSREQALERRVSQ